MRCRSLKPAKHAAQTLLRHKEDAQACAREPNQDAQPQPLAELHARSSGMAGSSIALAGSQTAAEGGVEEGSSGGGAGQGLESYPLPDSPDQAPLRGASASGAPTIAFSAQDQEAGASGRRGALEIESGQQPDQARAAEGTSGGGGGGGFPPQAPGAGDDVRWRPAQGFGMQQVPAAAAGQGSGYGVTAMLRIVDAEWHSRIEQDWYAATVAVDLFAFVYVALFYQVPPSSTAQYMLTAALECLYACTAVAA